MRNRSSVPAYQAIRQFIVNLADNHPGEEIKVPTLRELAGQFSVTEQTVNKVMQGLIADGYLVGRRGIGTFTNSARENVFTLPGGKKTPLIGIVNGDGMRARIGGHYECSLLGALLTHIGRNAVEVAEIRLTAHEPAIMQREISACGLQGLLWRGPDKTGGQVCNTLSRNGLPVLVIGQEIAGCSSLVFAIEKTAYCMGKILLRRGAEENVVYFPDAPVWAAQTAGLKRAYREAGHPLNSQNIFPSLAAAQKGLAAMLKKGIVPSAIAGCFLYNHEVEDYLLALNPELPKQCVLANIGFQKDHESPFEKIHLLPSFDELAAAAEKIVADWLVGNTQPQVLQIPQRLTATFPLTDEEKQLINS